MGKKKEIVEEIKKEITQESIEEVEKETKEDIKKETTKETDKAIIFRANRRLTKEEFELLSDLVKQEQKKTGLKIVLMPYSCEVEDAAE